jgi:flagellar FliJ protein
MKFDFPFESLLHHKKQSEGVARRSHMEAQAKVDSAKQRLKNLYEAIDEARSRVASIERNGGMRAPELSLIDDFINGQKLLIVKQREEIRELSFEAERTLEILVEAAKETKTLEKLKERKFEEFKLLRKRKELKAVDELVVTRFKNAGNE